MHSDAKFVLVVEKEASFQRLTKDNLLQKLHPCIVVTVSISNICIRVVDSRFKILFICSCLYCSCCSFFLLFFRLSCPFVVKYPART